jgi:tetratricopeptide (TPR) repeat protein
MTQVSSDLESALRLHQSGRLQEAERLYREVVRDDPFDSDALHLLGVTAHQQGRNDEAADYIIQAITIRPMVAEFHNNLGSVLHAMSRSEEAVAAYEEAIRLAPDDADSHFNLGNILSYLERFDQAAVSFEKTVELRSTFAEAYFSLGNVQKKLGRHADAANSYQRTLHIVPDYAKAHNNLGTALHDQGRIEEALPCYRQALQLDPHSADAYNNLGTALKKLERYDEAIDSYENALRLDPESVAVHFNLGNAYREQGNLHEAVQSYLQTLNRDSDHFEARINLAVSHKDLGEPKKAILCYEHVLKDRSDCAEAHFNRSLVWLQAGDLQRGWEEYEWRWKQDATQPRFQMPGWDGTPLEQKTILVFAEQGVGDEIMFASCLPDVIAISKKCIVECDRRLLPLFERSFPEAVFLPKPADQRPAANGLLSSVDVQCGIGSLPRWTRKTWEDFPTRDRYLETDSSLREKWNSRLAELGKGLKIGISWRGGKEADVRRKRSTNLGQWKNLFEISGVHFVNLQYGDCSAELREASHHLGIVIHDWDDADPLSNLDEFAAQIAELDIVISVDNSTVHLAGALGVPTWVLLPLAADWRWRPCRDHTPWYACLKLFQQPKRNDWSTLFDQVTTELRHRIS